MLLSSRLFIFYAGSILVILINFVFNEPSRLFTTTMSILAVMLLARVTARFSDIDLEQSTMVEEAQANNVHSKSRNYPDNQSVERMAIRMNKSLKKHLDIPCTILAIEDTGAAYEIDIILGDEDLLSAYQEVAIVPYDRIRDMDYWQQITKILINNYRIKNSSQPTVTTKQEMVKTVKRRRRPNSSQSNT